MFRLIPLQCRHRPTQLRLRLHAPLNSVWLQCPRQLHNQSSAATASDSPQAPSNPTTSASFPVVPPNPTSLHHDLPTFLAHASRTGLSPTSTTYIGTHYEYTVQSTLRRFGFNLSRTGGRGDSGIDLLGTWHLPPSLAPQPLRVLVQCKALKTKVGPNLIRELEGMFVGAPTGWKGKGVVGFLVSTREATKGVRDAMGRSRWAMGWVMLETNTEGSSAGELESQSEERRGEGVGKVKQVLWNKAASDVGLEGLNVTLKFDENGGKECVLMWQGKPVPGLNEQHQQT